MTRKISLMCDVEDDGVVACPDAPSIYDIPKVLHSEGLDAYVVRRLGLPFRDVDWTVWGDLLDRVHQPTERRWTIAIVGKYVDLPDAYLSVTEAIRAGGFAHRAKVSRSGGCPRTTARPRRPAPRPRSPGCTGCSCPGGFGVRGIEGKIGALDHARRHQIPVARPVPRPAVHGHPRRPRARRARRCANSAEFDETRPRYPVISTMADQTDVVAGERDMGGTMRLGAYPAVLAAGHRSPAPRTAPAGSPSGTGTATRSTTPTASGSPRPGWCSPGRRRRGRSSSSWSCRARMHPFFVGHPGAPRAEVAARRGPTRCSPRSSRRPCATTRRRGCSRTDHEEVTAADPEAPTTDGSDDVGRRGGRRGQRRRRGPRAADGVAVTAEHSRTAPPVAGTPSTLADPHAGHPPHTFDVVSSEILYDGRDLRAARGQVSACPAGGSRRGRRSSTSAPSRSPRSTTSRPARHDLPVPARDRAADLGDAGRAARRRRRRGAGGGREAASWSRRSGSTADDWSTLVDVVGCPGFADESVRVFLARGLHDVDRPAVGRRRGGRPGDPPGPAGRPRHRGDVGRPRQRAVHRRGVRGGGGRRRPVQSRARSTPPWLDRPTASTRPAARADTPTRGT